jgi:hypothetical protein
MLRHRHRRRTIQLDDHVIDTEALERVPTHQENQRVQIHCLLQLQHNVAIEHVAVEVEEGTTFQYHKLSCQCLLTQRQPETWKVQVLLILQEAAAEEDGLGELEVDVKTEEAYHQDSRLPHQERCKVGNLEDNLQCKTMRHQPLGQDHQLCYMLKHRSFYQDSK